MNINYVKSFTVAVALTISMSNVLNANELASIPEKTQATQQPSLEAKNILMAKLANLEHFSANFNQEVFSESGDLLEQSSGKLAISKPNLANWHTTSPDELAIVSDGHDVWFYNPWIEQVSVYSLTAAIAKTPMLLLTSKDETLWQEYTVTKNMVTETNRDTDKVADSFVISAKDVNSQIKSLTLIFDSGKENGQLKQFSFLDATGQLSHIKLADFDDKNRPEKSLFNFVLPEGVQIDDQRAN